MAIRIVGTILAGEVFAKDNFATLRREGFMGGVNARVEYGNVYIGTVQSVIESQSVFLCAALLRAGRVGDVAETAYLSIERDVGNGRISCQHIHGIGLNINESNVDGR